MANESLVAKVKAIVANARAGQLAEAYAGYRALFESPSFRTFDVADQRQALRLMVHAKGIPSPPSDAVIAAHRAATSVLEQLVSAHREPADYEMLGMCHVVTGNETRAGEVFRQGLAIERERNAQSDLCGALMKRVSML